MSESKMINFNDSGLIVNYIYSYLQEKVPNFNKEYHLNSSYTYACHKILTEYLQEKSQSPDEITAEVYTELVQMLNLWNGIYYDEDENGSISLLHKYGANYEEFTNKLYRCFIVPVVSQYVYLPYTWTSSSLPVYTYNNREDMVYRLANIDSMYDLLTDSQENWSTPVPFMTYSPATGFPLGFHRIETLGYKYLIVGMCLKSRSSSSSPFINKEYCPDRLLMISRSTIPSGTIPDANLSREFYGTTITNPTTSEVSYGNNANPWSVHRELIPFLLGRCISPISTSDEIWYVQKVLSSVDLPSEIFPIVPPPYKIQTPGVWDDQMSYILSYIKVIDHYEDTFLTRYYTVNTESYLNRLAAKQGKELYYYGKE